MVVSIGDEERVDPVVFLHGSRLLAATAALLGAIFGQRLRFHVTGMRHGHHHVLRCDQIFGIQLGGVQLDLRTATVAKFRLDRGEFVNDDRRNTFRTRQDIEQISDLGHYLTVLADNLVLLKTRQALQTHLQDFLRLGVGQTV